MANDGLCCRVPQGYGEVHSLVARRKDLCFYMWISRLLSRAISPLVSYSSTFWEDHLAHTPRDEASMEAVKFVLYEKLLFWIEVMSILGKTHEVSAILRGALEWPELAVRPTFISYIQL